MRLAVKHYGYVNEAVTKIGGFMRLLHPGMRPVSFILSEIKGFSFVLECSHVIDSNEK